MAIISQATLVCMHKTDTQTVYRLQTYTCSFTIEITKMYRFLFFLLITLFVLYERAFISIFLTTTKFRLFTAYKKALQSKQENRVDCSFDNPPQEGKVCTIPIDRYEPCISGTNFSYPKGKPCVYLKLNKVKYQTTNRK